MSRANVDVVKRGYELSTVGIWPLLSKGSIRISNGGIEAMLSTRPWFEDTRV